MDYRIPGNGGRKYTKEQRAARAAEWRKEHDAELKRRAEEKDLQRAAGTYRPNHPLRPIEENPWVSPVHRAIRKDRKASIHPREGESLTSREKHALKVACGGGWPERSAGKREYGPPPLTPEARDLLTHAAITFRQRYIGQPAPLSQHMQPPLLLIPEESVPTASADMILRPIAENNQPALLVQFYTKAIPGDTTLNGENLRDAITANFTKALAGAIRKSPLGTICNWNKIVKNLESATKDAMAIARANGADVAAHVAKVREQGDWVPPEIAKLADSMRLLPGPSTTPSSTPDWSEHLGTEP